MNIPPQKKTNIFVKCLGSQGTAYIVVIIATILLLIAGFFLYRKLQTTKFELESCRSSCSSV
jgi:cytochrome b subunit of formate dehydrogenase